MLTTLTYGFLARIHLYRNSPKDCNAVFYGVLYAKPEIFLPPGCNVVSFFFFRKFRAQYNRPEAISHNIAQYLTISQFFFLTTKLLSSLCSIIQHNVLHLNIKTHD
jgi:hypothetical protein